MESALYACLNSTLKEGQMFENVLANQLIDKEGVSW
jgi:hypothetical protein